MKQLKIEVGKFYQARDGGKVRIYATDCGGECPIHGSIFYVDVWSVATWTKDGHYGVIGQSCHDIVSEWKPTLEDIGFDPSCLPAWANKYIAKDSNGHWWAYESKPDQYHAGWDAADVASGKVFIPKEHTPKNFTGNWTESLFKIK